MRRTQSILFVRMLTLAILIYLCLFMSIFDARAEDFSCKPTNDGNRDCTFSVRGFNYDTVVDGSPVPFVHGITPDPINKSITFNFPSGGSAEYKFILPSYVNFTKVKVAVSGQSLGGIGAISVYLSNKNSDLKIFSLPYDKADKGESSDLSSIIHNYLESNADDGFNGLYQLLTVKIASDPGSLGYTLNDVRLSFTLNSSLNRFSDYYRSVLYSNMFKGFSTMVQQYNLWPSDSAYQSEGNEVLLRSSKWVYGICMTLASIAVDSNLGAFEDLLKSFIEETFSLQWAFDYTCMCTIGGLKGRYYGPSPKSFSSYVGLDQRYSELATLFLAWADAFRKDNGPEISIGHNNIGAAMNSVEVHYHTGSDTYNSYNKTIAEHVVSWITDWGQALNDLRSRKMCCGPGCFGGGSGGLCNTVADCPDTWGMTCVNNCGSRTEAQELAKSAFDSGSVFQNGIVKVKAFVDSVDADPPTGSVVINGDDGYTRTTSVTLSLNASPDAAQMCIGNTASCTLWETYKTATPWELGPGDGTKTVYASFKDGVGNVNPAPYSDTIILDSTAPVDGTLSATSGNGQVSLSWAGFSDAVSGIGSYNLVYSSDSAPTSCSIGTSVYSGPETHYNHTGLTNGTAYYYRVCARDNAGNTSAGSINSAIPSPTCTDVFEPNDDPNNLNFFMTTGMSYGGRICSETDVDWFKLNTTSPGTIWLGLEVPSSNDNYELQLYWNSPANLMRESTNGTGQDELIEHTTNDTGNYYVKVYGSKMYNGHRSYNTSTPYVLTYNFTHLLRIAGSGNGAIRVDGVVHSLPWGGNYTSGTEVKLEAVPGTGWGFSSWLGSLTGNTNPRTITMGSNKDIVVNFVKIDTTPPDGSILVNGNDVYTNTTFTTLSLSASDENGVTEMCISDTNSCSSWEPFVTVKPWTLQLGDGIKTVYAWLKDSVGNTNGAPYSDTIILDQTAPSDGAVVATPADGRVSLSWSGFSDATSGIRNYEVVFSNIAPPSSCSAGTRIYSGLNTAYDHGGLKSGVQYYYRICATDIANNTSIGVPASATVQDTTAPSLAVTSYTDGQHVSTSSITLAGTASDAGKGDNGIQQVTVNGVRASNDTASGSGIASWSTGLSLNPGPNAFTVIASDDSSKHNTTTPQSITIYYDAPIIYVEGTGICGGKPPCHPSIQSGINAAANGATIRVAQGTYHENILINEARIFVLEGGWDPTFEVRSDDPSATIIDGDVTGDGIGDGSVINILVSLGAESHIAITGLKIQNGNRVDGPGGGGINFESSGSLSLANVEISKNVATHGAGIRIVGNAQIKIDRCVLRDNVADGYGGAIDIGTWSGLLKTEVLNSLIIRNTGTAAIHAASMATIELQLKNNTITGNVSPHPSWNNMAGVTVHSCCGSLVTLDAVNNIIWGNNGTDLALSISGNPPEKTFVKASFNDIGTIYNEGGLFDDHNNINTDPLFNDPLRGDYRLTAGSPCIDKGTNDGTPVLDFEGKARPKDGNGDGAPVADIGAYEYVPPPPENGLCGSANGGTFTTPPTTNLCALGTPSAVSGTPPWIWTCAGSNGGSPANCQANLPDWAVASSVTGGNGTISCAPPAIDDLSSTCTISPNKGYRLDTLRDNGGDVTDQVIGNVYTIPTVTTNHMVIASFVAYGATIVWRNVCIGENTVWYMDGSTHTGTATLNPLTGPWRMVATADFNSDGQADILWGNFATGQNMVWYMNGVTRIDPPADVLPAEPDLNWRIVGVADFNSDGKPDIVWRNTSTGDNRVWYMNGTTRISSADLQLVADQNWKIVGAADFNSDGKPDLLWRNTDAGQNVVWYMDGITRAGLPALVEPLTDQTWTLVGTIDLNKDENPDLLWRNTASGANMVWYMTGVTHTGTAPLDTVADQNWEMAGQGNYSPPPLCNGACGAANGGVFASPPTTDLCSAGTPTPVSATPPWKWDCEGSNGGSTAHCQANSTGACKVVVVYPEKGGIVRPVAEQIIACCSTFSLRIEPDPGYSAVMGGTCGGSPQTGGPAPFTYTTYPVCKDCNITVTFVPLQCSTNAECGSGYYCGKPDGACGGQGVCISKPDVCPMVFVPVCGCDGNTYDNSCAAAWAGVTVANQGRCQGAGICGSANGGTFTSPPAMNLCSAGTPSSVIGSGDGWTWTCQGIPPAQCKAYIQMWAITTSVPDGNGTVSCTSPVMHGSSAGCTISPRNGYRLYKLRDNGKEVTLEEFLASMQHITTNHVIEASFVPIGTTIFWRNVCTGENKVLYVDGSTYAGADSLDPLPGPWRMAATADFNNDGQADIVWRNFTTGAVMVWYMNGAMHTGSADVLPSETDLNSRMVGTGDFNNDGHPDILWRNMSTGANTVWYMNEATRIGLANLTPVPNQDWKIVGVADFNGDGKPDILWWNSKTGLDVVWYMHGIDRVESETLDTTDPTWKKVAIIDLNGDGRPDIVWRNTASGAIRVCYSGGGCVVLPPVPPPLSDQNWEMAGEGNYSPRPVCNGVCGSANGGIFTSPPTTNLCSSGTPSGVSATPPWTWSCIGSNGGSTAQCQANNMPDVCTVTIEQVGSGGTVSPIGERSVPCGSAMALTITVMTGYDVSVDSTCGGSPWIGPVQPPYIINPIIITKSCTIVVTFFRQCSNNVGCDAGYYCAKSTGACGGQGVCTIMPQGCTTVWDPVCGCNGITYSNSCAAASAGITIGQSGVCGGAGVCGSAHGGTFTSAPTNNLCAAGTPSTVAGSGPWTWTCQGNPPAQCQAYIKKWEVTTSVPSGNGTITCNSPVKNGSDSTCTINPYLGHRLSTLTDNGADVKGQVAGNVYTIRNVTSDHAVTASFATGATIFWRNVSTGENTLWYMDGATHTGTATLDPLTGPWRMVAVADFNHDGERDVLWRNFSTGANMLWYMNGTTHTGSADLTPLADQNWRIVGVADFNGDGSPDILWRNMSTGANMVWYMNEATRLGSVDLTTVPNQDWKIVGVADFNSDGKPDIVWRNIASGLIVVWYLDGITRTDYAIVDTVTDLNWKIVGTIDLNNDGKQDILWRHTATGQNSVWYMDGVHVTQVQPLDTEPNLNIEMAGQSNY